MSNTKKRSYKSESRSAQAAETKASILKAAENVFALEGFEGATIEKIAALAAVSIPTVYALFQSKRGILRALMDAVFPQDLFEALVEKSKEAASPQERLRYSAKIARQIYDAERRQMDIFRGASVLSPAFKECEQEREMRRYERQKITIDAMLQDHSLTATLDASRARDILWTFTGRDIYRLLVIERGWAAEEYENWLSGLLTQVLLNHSS